MKVIIKEKVTLDNGNLGAIVEIYGTSNEEKPTCYSEGSVFIEIDTRQVFMFNEETQTWVEW